jgi:transcriptional regulator with XRE-family HTH domain
MPEPRQNHALAIGEKLRTARQRSRMSLRALAVKAEMSASMLSQIENGKAYPSVRSMYSIATALGLPVDYFFPENNPPVESPGIEPLTASELRQAQLDGTVVDSSQLTRETGPAPTPIVHAATRPAITLKGGITWARLTAQVEQGAEFLEITYAPGASSGASMSHHVGREFGLVLEGELLIELGFERYTLKAGDSIVFDSMTPHRLTNGCTKPMRALWIVLNSG